MFSGIKLNKIETRTNDYITNVAKTWRFEDCEIVIFPLLPQCEYLLPSCFHNHRY